MAGLGRAVAGAHTITKGTLVAIPDAPVRVVMMTMKVMVVCSAGDPFFLVRTWWPNRCLVYSTSIPTYVARIFMILLVMDTRAVLDWHRATINRKREKLSLSESSALQQYSFYLSIAAAAAAAGVAAAAAAATVGVALEV